MFLNVLNTKMVVIDLNLNRLSVDAWTFATQRMSAHEHRTDRLPSTDRSPAHPGIPRLCSPLRGQPARAQLFLLGSTPVHDVRPTDLSGKALRDIVTCLR